MKKIIFFTLFVCTLVFCFPFHAKADLAPGIYVMQLTGQVEGKQITGNFTVENFEQYYLSDLNYEIELWQGSSFANLKPIDTIVPDDTFFVSPKGTITKTFTYTYPQNIPSGDYTLRIQIITGRGTELGWQDAVFSLKGSANFLNIDYAKPPQVIVGKQTATPLSGINVSSTDKVVASLNIQNPGDQITVVPQITVFQRQVNMPIVKQYQDSPITFAKGEEKAINLTMPNLTTPESYLAEVKFLQNGNQVSGIQYFRWVVEGTSGKIIYVEATKDFYKAGDSINLTIQTVGPADGSDIGQGQLQVTATDKNGNLVGTTSTNVELSGDLVDSAISIPVKSDLTSPAIDVKLLKGTTVLDERKINLPVFSPEAKQLQQQIQNQETSAQQTKTYFIYLICAIIIVLILIAGFTIYKIKSSKKQ